MPDLPPDAAFPLPRRPAFRGVGRAFTLIEILLVLALIGLLTSVFVVGVNRMLETPPVTAEGAFWAMVTEARRYALQHEINVRMTFDETTTSLLATADDGTVLPAVVAPTGTKYVFQPGLTASTASSGLGSSLVTDTPLTAIMFYSDGTCSLFRLQVEGGGFGMNAAQIVQIDPWTCAPLVLASGTTSTGGIMGGF